MSITSFSSIRHTLNYSSAMFLIMSALNSGAAQGLVLNLVDQKVRVVQNGASLYETTTTITSHSNTGNVRIGYFGVHVLGNGRAHLGDVTALNNGGLQVMLHAEGPDTSINIQNLDLTTRLISTLGTGVEASAFGLVSRDGGQITIDGNANIIVDGSQCLPTGWSQIPILAAGGSIKFNGHTDILTNDAYAAGAVSTSGGDLSFKTLNITTQGKSSPGLQAGREIDWFGGGNIIVEDHLTINVTGDHSPAIYMNASGASALICPNLDFI